MVAQRYGKSIYYLSPDDYYGYLDEVNTEVVSELVASLASLLGKDNLYANEIIADTLVNMAESINDPVVANRAITALLPFVGHKNATVRQSVVDSLAVAAAKIDDPELANKVVIRLLPLLRDEDNDIQKSAAECLGHVIDVVGNPQVAANVSEALKALLKDHNSDVRSSASSASAHARSWLDAQLLLSQLQNPADYQERKIAISALFLVALRDPAQLRAIKEELELLYNAPEPFIRIAAAQTLEMLNIAALVHDVIEGSTSLSKVKLYLREMAPDSFDSSYYYDPYSSQLSLHPSASDHVKFAVGEALAKLDQFEQAQKKDK